MGVMASIVSLLLLMSMSLIVVGFGLLFTVNHDERELSPAELSTSAPIVRGCWSRLQALAARRVLPVRRRRSTRPRAAVIEMAEISAARTLFAGRVSALFRSASGSAPTPQG
jgi:hypothetical protein